MSETTVEIVRTPSGPMAVRRAGSGPPVVLLHPLALSGEVWGPLTGALADRFEVFALDLRGHGGSGWDGRPFSIEELAGDVAAVLDALRVPAAGLLGLCMGGSVAVVFAGLFPTRAETLVLADTTAWYGDDAVAIWAERARRATDVPRSEQVPFQVNRWFTPAYQESHAAEVERLVQIFLRTDGRAHAASATALGRLDARPLLPAVTAPTLVMVGEDDYATPPAMAGALAGGIPGASLMCVPGLRHLSPIERPELAAVVRQVFGGWIATGPA
jgi:3-oxoadipate enol-lactonase